VSVSMSFAPLLPILFSYARNPRFDLLSGACVFCHYKAAPILFLRAALHLVRPSNVPFLIGPNVPIPVVLLAFSDFLFTI